MFKAIKEFFVGKPKVEEAPAQCPFKVEAAVQPEPEPVVAQKVAEVVPEAVVETVPEVSQATMIETPAVEEINITTVTINDQITDAVTITSKPIDTISTGAWPFPNNAPSEGGKKKRTFVKREEPATTKKPVPAIKAKNTKTRKKK